MPKTNYLVAQFIRDIENKTELDATETKNVLEDFVDSLPFLVEDIVDEDIHHYVNEHLKGLPREEISRNLEYVREFCKYLHENEVIMKHPFRDVEETNPDIPRCLPEGKKWWLSHHEIQLSRRGMQKIALGETISDSQLNSLTQGKLIGLYYPYSRCLDENTLKTAVLVFDEVWFADPLDRAARQQICYYNVRGSTLFEKWNRLKDKYDLLYDEGAIRIVNPYPILRKYDLLLTAALEADISDPNFMKLCIKECNRDSWGILREKLPLKYQRKSVRGRYGSIDLREVGDRISSPRHEVRKPTYEMSDIDDFSSLYLVNIAHEFVPYECGMAVNVNHALLLSQVFGISPLSESSIAQSLLKYKYLKAIQNTDFLSQVGLEGVAAHRTQLRKSGVLAMLLFEGSISQEEIAKRSIKDIIKYRRACKESREHFRNKVLSLVHQIESEPWSPEFEDKVTKIIDTDLRPEMQRVRDEMQAVYEKLHGGVLLAGASVLSSSIVGFSFAQLSWGLVLAAATSVGVPFFNVALKELVNAWREKRKLMRSSVSYLLNLQAQNS